MKIISKTASTGQKIEIVLESGEGLASVIVMVDGVRLSRNRKAMRLPKPSGETTHWIGFQLAKGQAIGLTTAEANQITAAIKAADKPAFDPATTWMGDASMDAADSIF